MKSLFLSVLVSAAAVLVSAADNPSISGKWKVHTSVAGNDSDADCSFTQKDIAITGSCTTDQGDVKITGKAEGSKITWSYNADYNGTALTVSYSGIVDAATSKIAGSVSVDPFGVDGDFTATQAK
jgi:hypothetical protein